MHVLKIKKKMLIQPSSELLLKSDECNNTLDGDDFLKAMEDQTTYIPKLDIECDSPSRKGSILNINMEPTSSPAALIAAKVKELKRKYDNYSSICEGKSPKLAKMTPTKSRVKKLAEKFNAMINKSVKEEECKFEKKTKSPLKPIPKPRTKFLSRNGSFLSSSSPKNKSSTRPNCRNTSLITEEVFRKLSVKDKALLFDEFLDDMTVSKPSSFNFDDSFIDSLNLSKNEKDNQNNLNTENELKTTPVKKSQSKKSKNKDSNTKVEYLSPRVQRQNQHLERLFNDWMMTDKKLDDKKRNEDELLNKSSSSNTTQIRISMKILNTPAKPPRRSEKKNPKLQPQIPIKPPRTYKSPFPLTAPIPAPRLSLSKDTHAKNINTDSNAEDSDTRLSSIPKVSFIKMS